MSPRLKRIDFLIKNGGKVTLGCAGPVSCAAVASDGHQALAMLVRQRRESLMRFLERLDAAIDDAEKKEIYADEINR